MKVAFQVARANGKLHLGDFFLEEVPREAYAPPIAEKLLKLHLSANRLVELPELPWRESDLTVLRAPSRHLSGTTTFDSFFSQSSQTITEPTISGQRKGRNWCTRIRNYVFVINLSAHTDFGAYENSLFSRIASRALPVPA